jgi:prepilin-type processing-associated H-X9-DG protein
MSSVLHGLAELPLLKSSLDNPTNVAVGKCKDMLTKATGVSFLRTGVRVGEISDGLSTTYFAGEKYVDTRGYDSAVDDGHDQTMFSGVDLDNARWTIEPPLQDRNAAIPRRFGRPHSGGCFMAMCDGSVALTSYSIDAGVFRAGGTRSGSADF